MLEIVSKGFRSALGRLSGKTELTEANVEEAVRDVRISLLEADVEVSVAKGFIERVKQKALGRIVATEVSGAQKKLRASPADHFIAICQEELEALLGAADPQLGGEPIVFKKPLTTIMMVGLQGTGKTTTTGKLANYLLARKRRPLLVAADVYRPAAAEQLAVLGRQLGVPVFREAGVLPPELCERALKEARKQHRDVVIFDTAGRLAIDEPLMGELEEITRRTKPDNVFLVVDALVGQDAVKTAAEFNRRLPLSGFIMTKLDGDARGGAALSIRSVTGKSIKFLGSGETLDKLEEFRPQGLASRILGMGDVVGLVKDFEAVVDEKQAERDAKKLLGGKFTFDDFLEQIKLIQKMGSVKDLLEKFPLFGASGPPEGMNIDDKQFVRIQAMIQSMTAKERAQPNLIGESRLRRIAKGSGNPAAEVKALIERFEAMKKMMEQIGHSPGLLGQLPGLKQLSQLNRLRKMDMGQLFGGMPDLGALASHEAGEGNGLPAGLPSGYFPPGFAAARPSAAISAAARQSKKDKRKAQKQARKRSRR